MAIAMKWLAAALISAGTAALMTTPVQARENRDTFSAPLRDAVAGLPVAVEKRDGYDRDKFHIWVDVDGNGCNTRREVLIAEAVTKPTVGPKCALSGGKWLSYYDNATWTNEQDLDIDHFVALAEAWDSGAYNWTDDQRKRYGNDLGDERPLIAVTDDVNQAKGDKDPTDWLPPLASVKCRYVNEWVAVKARWRLTVDEKEKATLTDLAAGCPNDTITVERAL